MIYAVGIVAASVYLLGSTLYFGNKAPGYNHVSGTISELGESGSVFEKNISYGVFLPVGLSLLLMSTLLYFQGLHDETQKSLCGLGTCVGVGYVVAAFFPCDPGSPLSGSTRQSIHNLGGIIEYLGGAYFLTVSSVPLMRTIGFLVLSLAIMMSFSFCLRWRGLIQRFAELGLFAGLIVLSLKI